MRFKRALHFTLLEILIAIGIIATVSGVIAISIRKFYLEQKALDGMVRVTELIRTAQELMMIANLDSEVEISRSGEKTVVQLIPKSAVSPLIANFVTQAKVEVETIDAIEFEDAFRSIVLRPKFSLSFISKGFLLNRGVLKMRGGGISRSLVLLGYPAPLKLEAGERVFYPYSDEIQRRTEEITRQTAIETKTL